MDIGSKIRNAREDMDLSQKEVAELIPMNQSNYSKIERNIQEPNLFQLKRIVEILHLDVVELLELNPVTQRKHSDRRFLEDIIALYNKKYK